MEVDKTKPIYDMFLMKPRMGRPKLKAKERKEIFPLRLSALELQAIKDAAGDEPLAKWMRRTLLLAVPSRNLAALGIVALLDKAVQSGGTVSVKVKPAAPKRSLTPHAIESP